MPCPVPPALASRRSRNEEAEEALREQAAFEARERAKVVARVVELHEEGLGHPTIMVRLGLSRPTVTKMLKESGHSGASADQTNYRGQYVGKNVMRAAAGPARPRASTEAIAARFRTPLSASANPHRCSCGAPARRDSLECEACFDFTLLRMRRNALQELSEE